MNLKSAVGLIVVLLLTIMFTDGVGIFRNLKFPEKSLKTDLVQRKFGYKLSCTILLVFAYFNL